MGTVAYKLKLPSNSRIHLIFHVSLLKKKLGDSCPTSVDLPPIIDEGEFIVEPKSILETPWIKQGKKFIEESMVKWKRLPTKDAT